MELIKVTQDAKGQSVVSARDLHTFLEVKEKFADWCKRMFDYGFEENQDYTEVFPQNQKNPKGGRPSVDYALTLDTAKEISMLQRSDRGKQARQYFIKCERELREAQGIEAGKLFAFQQKLEAIWNTLQSAKAELEHIDSGFAELAKDLHALPAHAEVVAEPIAFMTVADFFRNKGVVLSMVLVAHYNNICRKHARKHKLPTASGGERTIAFTLPTLDEAWRVHNL